MLLAAAVAVAATMSGAAGASAVSPALSPEISPPPSPDISPPVSPDMSPSPEASPFGAGCAAIEDSLAGIADQPVGTAISEVPELSMLADAVEQAGLADRLNDAKDITVFAPNNEAFEAIPQERREAVMADKEQLTRILSYHVVEGRKAPADLEGATLKTLQGGELTVKGSGDDLTINDAKVVCGNIPTANATVYVIDKILMPR
ncbi:fasciclin domain-containing protein [Nonomuraea sp. SYSU D8015]|uniref:fasciclin domain-containing protein n=1 Tax=Nonomuraea sp. SYSU D8015 TaxID=2593644 RepID=UPI0016605444|nr:fasciclin domain-containing protein [Nonomuraea sp. SYSU D8015]